jgi:two-component system cell cycle sensor histidine kinase/response regulator CckA
METILLVDDEPAVLTLCQTMLKSGGYHVLSAGSGQEAMRLLHGNVAKVDLALLDVIMPGINGVELAARIQIENPAIKIVLMSGYGLQEIASVVGDNRHKIIWKPFKTESLLRMIENALGDAPSET